MPNLVNEMIYRELEQGLAKASGMVFLAVHKLTVKETEGLRNELHGGGVRMRIVRNRLARKALAARGLETPKELLAGNVAVMWGDSEQAIFAAKVFSKSAFKKQGKIAFRGGMLEGNLVGGKEAEAMSALPSRKELQATLLGVISAPARTLATVLSALPSSTARVLQARIDAQGGADGASAA